MSASQEPPPLAANTSESPAPGAAAAPACASLRTPAVPTPVVSTPAMPAILKARLAEALATATETEQTKAAYRAETQRQQADRYAQASTKRIQLSADNSKADQRQKQTQLISPVDGTLQQLMEVVPDSTQVTAEVAIANQGIGFVNASQAAEIKLDTFSFTKYSTVKATVDNVSADAVRDEKRGSFYPATLTLEKKARLIDGKQRRPPSFSSTGLSSPGGRRPYGYKVFFVSIRSQVIYENNI